MSQAELVSRLETLRDVLPWPSPEFDAVHSLVNDLTTEAFNEAAYLVSLEAQWENRQALAGHDRADRYMFAA